MRRLLLVLILFPSLAWAGITSTNTDPTPQGTITVVPEALHTTVSGSPVGLGGTLNLGLVDPMTLTGLTLTGPTFLNLGVASTTYGKATFFSGANANTTTFTVGSVPANITFTWPTQDGNSGDCLVTDGAGHWTFTPTCGGAAGGILTLGGQSGSVQSFGNDTNVTMTSASNVHTLGWTGLLGLARGGTHTDLSGTGGASKFLRQNSVGADITVVQPAFTDLSGNLACGQLPALTGAVTTSAGSCATSFIAAATFVTSVTTPLIYGGTAAGSTLTLAGTSNGAPVNAHVILNASAQGNVGIGTTTPNVGAFGSGTIVSIVGANKGVVELVSTAADAAATDLGYLAFIGSNNTSGKRMAEIYAQSTGTTANNRGAYLGISIKPDGAALAETVRITSTTIGLGTTSANVGAFSASNFVVTVGRGTGEGILELLGNTSASGAGLGSLAFTNETGAKRGARIEAITNGTSGSADLAFSTSTTGTLAEVMRLDKAGNMKLNAYGAGALSTDASGNVTAGILSRPFGGWGSDVSGSTGVVSFNAGTPIFNNVLTAGRILYGAAGNTVLSSADFTFDAAQVVVGGVARQNITAASPVYDIAGNTLGYGLTIGGVTPSSPTVLNVASGKQLNAVQVNLTNSGAGDLNAFAFTLAATGATQSVQPIRGLIGTVTNSGTGNAKTTAMRLQSVGSGANASVLGTIDGSVDLISTTNTNSFIYGATLDASGGALASARGSGLLFFEGINAPKFLIGVGSLGPISWDAAAYRAWMGSGSTTTARAIQVLSTDAGTETWMVDRIGFQVMTPSLISPSFANSRPLLINATTSGLRNAAESGLTSNPVAGYYVVNNDSSTSLATGLGDHTSVTGWTRAIEGATFTGTGIASVNTYEIFGSSSATERAALAGFGFYNLGSNASVYGVNGFMGVASAVASIGTLVSSGLFELNCQLASCSTKGFGIVAQNLTSPFGTTLIGASAFFVLSKTTDGGATEAWTDAFRVASSYSSTTPNMRILNDGTIRVTPIAAFASNATGIAALRLTAGTDTAATTTQAYGLLSEFFPRNTSANSEFAGVSVQLTTDGSNINGGMVAGDFQYTRLTAAGQGGFNAAVAGGVHTQVSGAGGIHHQGHHGLWLWSGDQVAGQVTTRAGTAVLVGSGSTGGWTHFVEFYDRDLSGATLFGPLLFRVDQNGVIFSNAPSGFTGNVMDFQVNGTSQFKVRQDGLVTNRKLAGVAASATVCADINGNLFANAGPC
jgi:hypothetical protein